MKTGSEDLNSDGSKVENDKTISRLSKKTYKATVLFV